MARPQKGTISKRAAVIEFLGKGLPTKDVPEAVKKSYKLAVNPSYVANIKSSLKKSDTNGHKPMVLRNGHGELNTLTAAVEFIRAAGSIDAAKQAIRTVEEIRQLA